jgi:hypothetical protein
MMTFTTVFAHINGLDGDHIYSTLRREKFFVEAMVISLGSTGQLI